MAEAQPRQGGLLVNLLCNIVIPTIIMIRFSGEEDLGPLLAIVIALAFPVTYGIADFVRTRKANLFSILGFISVLLTGTMSLLKLPPEYIAIKEAAIPAIFGLATLISLRTRWPLVRTLLFNEQIMKIALIEETLEARNNRSAFDDCLRKASYMVAASFFLSSVLNYVLAKVILVSEPGTTAFTEELGKMQALSFPVIALPSTIVLMAALWYLLKQVQRLTGIDLEDLFNTPPT